MSNQLIYDTFQFLNLLDSMEKYGVRVVRDSSTPYSVKISNLTQWLEQQYSAKWKVVEGQVVIDFAQAAMATAFVLRHGSGES